MNIHLTEDVDFPIWIQTISHLLGTPAALALTQCRNPDPAAGPEQFDPLLTRSDLKTWCERSDIYLAHLEASIRDKTHRLPRFRSLNSRIKNYLTADEPRNCLGKFDFPEDLYSTPFAHFYHLAAKVYDVSPSGSLACKIDPDMKRIVASYFPLTFLKAARIACEAEFPDDFPPADFPESYENQFAAIFADGLADTHVHLGQALLYDDLVMPAMAGIRIPDCAHLHGSGSTKHVLWWYDKRIFLQNILLACRGSLAALTEFIKSENDNFMNFLSGKKNEREYKDADNSERDNRKEDNHLSRDVWEALLRLKCAPDSRRVWESGKDLRFFKREVRRLAMHGGDFRNWKPFNPGLFTIFSRLFRRQLARPKDRRFNQYLLQTLRALNFIYSKYAHREWSHEFQSTLDITRELQNVAGIDKPGGKRPEVGWILRRQIQDGPLSHIQLRKSISRSPATHSIRQGFNNLLTEYKDLLNADRDRDPEFVTVAFPETNGTWKCFRMAKDRDPRFVTVVFPVQLSKRPPDTQKKKVFSPGKNTFSPHPYPSATRRFRWPFGKIWSEATALADFFNKYPKYRRFFGYIDVAGHEDEMPNWPLSLALQEFHARLHPWKTKPGEPPSCNIYLSSHQGEQFQTPLQGLRRIWEGIQHLQSQALGHALALKNADFSEESMALEELLDDLVWAWEMLVKYDSPAATLTQRLERRFEEILRNQHLDSTIKIETWEAARKILFSVDKMEKIGILRKEPGAEKKHFYAGYPKQYLPPNSLKGNTERLDSEKCRKFLDFLKSCGLEEDPERLCLERISNSEWSMPYHLKDCREDLRKAYEILVNMVLEKIRKKGVIIQLCPTSNLVIGGLRSYTDHPLFDYDSHGNGLDKGLLTLNTDDPTVFQVSIYDETATMYMAAKRKWPEKSNEQIASWIRDICRVGRESCCPSLRGFTKTGIIAAIDECLQG